VASVLLFGGLGASSYLPPSIVWVALFASLVAAVSLLDDLRPMPQLVRLAVHILAAVGLAATVGMFDVIALPGVATLQLGPFAAVVTVVWLAGFTNAFNFMDGSDGMAAGFAVVAGVAWAVIGLVTGNDAAGLAGLALAAASFGFLVHNWSPARIFMGDVGSAFLGFSLAALPLVGSPAPALAGVGVLILWPFLFDTGFTLARRALKREPLLIAHRSHLYQRLILGGWTHQGVALLYMSTCAVTAAAALFWLLTGSNGLALAVPTASSVALLALVARAERPGAAHRSEVAK
jgi:UDP-N-acetylmuramyl pentapeptide phosphotransferase/UDP-N-acetylglucosamine-1-phosphate transferase